MKEILIGSDVTALKNSMIATGIQRVLVETHKTLTENLNQDHFLLRGFTQNLMSTENYLRNEYLKSDPLLQAPLVDLSEVDLALYLDINYFTDITKYFKLKNANSNFKMISLIHDIFPISNPEWYLNPVETKAAYKRYLQSNLILADYIVVASHKVKNDLERLNWKTKGEIRVIPMGTYKHSLAIEPKARENQKVNLICVATIEPRKGLHDLLDAFDLLTATNLDVELNLVGNYGWGAEELADRIEKHPEINQRLFWHSAISDEKMEEIYRNADFAILPSYDEGFGLTFEEALAHKRIVIARDIEIFRERESSNVRYFAGKGEDLAKMIINNLDQSWDSTQNQKVRTMLDFASDLQSLIEEAVNLI
jgi:glycosyltransferase involved in cell wall biosynthesis